MRERGSLKIASVSWRRDGGSSARRRRPSTRATARADPAELAGDLTMRDVSSDRKRASVACDVGHDRLDLDHDHRAGGQGEMPSTSMRAALASNVERDLERQPPIQATGGPFGHEARPTAAWSASSRRSRALTVPAEIRRSSRAESARMIASTCADGQVIGAAQLRRATPLISTSLRSGSQVHLAPAASASKRADLPSEPDRIHQRSLSAGPSLAMHKGAQGGQSGSARWLDSGSDRTQRPPPAGLFPAQHAPRSQAALPVGRPDPRAVRDHGGRDGPPGAPGRDRRRPAARRSSTRCSPRPRPPRRPGSSCPTRRPIGARSGRSSSSGSCSSAGSRS